MAPRILESDDEFDELESTSDEGITRSSTVQPSIKQPAAAGSRTSARTVKITPIPAKSQQQSSRPAARQAAIKANESMDVDGAIASDEDGAEDLDELDQLAEEDVEDEEEGEDDDDAEGEDEDEYNDTASVRGGDIGANAQASPSTSTGAGNPVKIKLKLGGHRNPANTSSPALAPTIISLRGKGKTATAGTWSGTTSPASSVKGDNKKGKVAAQMSSSSKSKRKRKDMDELRDEDEEQSEEALDDQDEEEEEEEDYRSDDTAESNMSVTKMTARQRAAHIGAEPEYLSLPQAPSKKKIFTEDEAAMRKVETSRRRKHLLNKKLEEEKQETIERLLKKPIGRRSGPSTSRIAAATKVDRSSTAMVLPITGGVDENGQVIPPSEMALHAQIVLPTSFRWVSSTKTGVYNELWGVPFALEDRFSWPEMAASKVEEMESKSKALLYPPPRPPPKSRIFSKTSDVAVAA